MKKIDLGRRILTDFRSIAVVGVSTKPEKDSYQVARYLIDQGYRVYLVNPKATEIMGQPSYPDLKSIPEPVSVVNVFRRPDRVMPLIDEAVSIGARAVWLQPGAVNEEAAARARKAGLLVVMDRCIRSDHRRLHKPPAENAEKVCG